MTSQVESADIVLAGASARACAQSANLAKLTPESIDLFSDLDTQEAGPTTRISQYPYEIQKVMKEQPTLPWMYLGGMENYPELVAKISAKHPLLGCSPDSLHDVKSAFLLQEILAQEKLPALKISTGDKPPVSGTWLKKPMVSAGGQRISFYNIAGRSSLEEPVDYYFQEYLPGSSFSAVCLAIPCKKQDSTDKIHNGQLLGITRQLTGEVWCNAPRFVYCGSIGPIKLATESVELIQKLADAIARNFKLQGLFGIDLVLDSRGIPHVVEINPRYTASMELFERYAGLSLLELHCSAFGWNGKISLKEWLRGLTVSNVHTEIEESNVLLKSQAFEHSSNLAQGMMGKVVLYANSPMTVKENWNWDDYLTTEFVNNNEENLQVSDRPRGGVFIGAGDPICTLLIRGESESHTYDLLRRRSLMLHQHLLDKW